MTPQIITHIHRSTQQYIFIYTWSWYNSQFHFPHPGMVTVDCWQASAQDSLALACLDEHQSEYMLRTTQTMYTNFLLKTNRKRSTKIDPPCHPTLWIQGLGGTHGGIWIQHACKGEQFFLAEQSMMRGVLVARKGRHRHWRSLLKIHCGIFGIDIGDAATTLPVDATTAPASEQ